MESATSEATAPVAAGYRVLRELARGPRASLWLASVDAPGGALVALKTRHRGAPPAVAVREAEALWRARGEHCAELVEIASDERAAPILVFDVVEHRLAPILERGIPLGAAITILLPLAETIERIHRAGVAHGAIDATAIGVDERGAPVLLGFGSAIIAGERSLPAVDRGADAAAFFALARRILDAVDGQSGRDASLRDRASAWLAHADPLAPEWGREFASRIAALGVPQPIPLEPARASAPQGGGTAAAGVPGAGSTGFDERVRARIAGMRARLGGVRRAVWVPAVAVVVLLLVVVPLMSGLERDVEVRGVTSPDSSAPLPAVEAGGRELGADADPVAAATALLARRATCFALRALDCLADVVQAGSPAELEDRLAISNAIGPGGLEIDPVASVELQQELGGAVLLLARTSDAGGAARAFRVLLVRTEEGWRIRSLSAAPQGAT